MSVNLNLLKATPYLAGLNESSLASISRYIFEKKAERGDIIVYEGEPAEALYLIIEGVVKSFKTSAGGKEQILRIIRPGDSFNDVPVLAGGVNLASAAAMSPVVLHGIKKKDLETISSEYPQVALNIIKILSLRVQEMITLVEDLSFRRVNGRVAKILLEYADNDEKPHLTQQEIAAMIGTAREMVGRSFKNLEEEGAIRLERNRIIISDHANLKKIAGITE